MKKILLSGLVVASVLTVGLSIQANTTHKVFAADITVHNIMNNGSNPDDTLLTTSQSEVDTVTSQLKWFNPAITPSVVGGGTESVMVKGTYGSGDFAVSTTGSDNQAVYRLNNVKTGKHMFVVGNSAAQFYINTASGWTLENSGKPVFYSEGTVPVYHLMRTDGTNYYTTNADSKLNIVLSTNPNKWTNYGVAWYTKTPNLIGLASSTSTSGIVTQTINSHY